MTHLLLSCAIKDKGFTRTCGPKKFQSVQETSIYLGLVHDEIDSQGGIAVTLLLCLKTLLKIIIFCLINKG